ncbi:phosphotransferase family protein [Bacillus timonensis]|nr:phosphotransferase family protein [Bacillus timonensis]
MKLKVNWLEYILGSEWEIYPAGGATGDAYFAQFNERKLFLKRNSSPFLAVLSAEGIVPKLVWTKRLENGDVITAQHWLNGRELKPVEMYGENVAKLLSKIHHSNELLDMLKRLGKKPLLPEEVLSDVKMCINTPQELPNLPLIQSAIQFLEQEVNHIKFDHHVVCHCDINHNNWLLTENEQLYLIDWDGAMIADPAMDIGLLLYWYIRREDWNNWLNLYGIHPTDDLFARMKWYVIAQTILSISWYHSKNHEKEVQHWLKYLQNLISN